MRACVRACVHARAFVCDTRVCSMSHSCVPKHLMTSKSVQMHTLFSIQIKVGRFKIKMVWGHILTCLGPEKKLEQKHSCFLSMPSHIMV